MTEIKIEKKKLIWPWILLGIAIIVALIYFLVFHNYNDEVNEVPKAPELENTINNTNETDFISINENNSTVAAYVTFVEMERNSMSLDHEYTNEALLKLIQATEAMANEVEYDVQTDLEKVKKYAEMILKEPFETTHANKIRKADDILTNILQNIQDAKYPGLTNEVAELKEASEAIKPNILTLDQKNEVKTFFSKAAILLKKMN